MKKKKTNEKLFNEAGWTESRVLLLFLKQLKKSHAPVHLRNQTRKDKISSAPLSSKGAANVQLV